MNTPRLLQGKRYHLVYVTVNRVNFKCYVGVHSTDDLEDGYLGSGVVFKKALKKYGKGNFYRSILRMCATREEAEEFEKYYVNRDVVLSDEVYNVKLGGGNGWGMVGQHNGASKSKMSEEKRKEKGRKGYETRLARGKVRTGDAHNFSRSWLGDAQLRAKTVKGVKTRIESGVQAELVERMQTTKREAAPKYLLVSPTGEEFITQHNLLPFCKEHHLAYQLIWCRISKQDFGIIKLYKRLKNPTLPQLNTIGWGVYPWRASDSQDNQ